jgi:hypothetical protein
MHALCNKFYLAHSIVSTTFNDMAKYLKEVKNARPVQTILIHTRVEKTVMWING